MKLNHVDGEVTDTDKLPDIQALILEKAEELRVLCCNERIQLLLLVDIKHPEIIEDKKFACVSSFWNIKTKEWDSNPEKEFPMAIDKFFIIVNKFIHTFSKGTLHITRTDDTKE